jgi:hypothetical protein
MVAFTYFNFKKDVNLETHVKMFNSIVKANEFFFEEYIINAFNYMLRDLALTGVIITCQNFLIVLFQSLHKHFANIIRKM